MREVDVVEFSRFTTSERPVNCHVVDTTHRSSKKCRESRRETEKKKNFLILLLSLCSRSRNVKRRFITLIIFKCEKSSNYANKVEWKIQVTAGASEMGWNLKYRKIHAAFFLYFVISLSNTSCRPLKDTKRFLRKKHMLRRMSEIM